MMVTKVMKEACFTPRARGHNDFWTDACRGITKR